MTQTLNGVAGAFPGAQDVQQGDEPLSLKTIVDLERYWLDEISFRQRCKRDLDEQGALVLPGFLTAAAVARLASEGEQCRHLAYYTLNDHNIYLRPTDPAFADDHPRNRRVTSSKGCITTDQISADSSLRTLYDSSAFKNFLCAMLDESSLYEYADPLSSINLHYAAQGQELGWHFDNSSFAITLLIQKPEAGASFEYVKDVRDADRGDMSYEQAGKILDGQAGTGKNTIDGCRGTGAVSRAQFLTSGNSRTWRNHTHAGRTRIQHQARHRIIGIGTHDVLRQTGVAHLAFYR